MAMNRMDFIFSLCIEGEYYVKFHYVQLGIVTNQFRYWFPPLIPSRTGNNQINL